MWGVREREREAGKIANKNIPTMNKKKFSFKVMTEQNDKLIASFLPK